MFVLLASLDSIQDVSTCAIAWRILCGRTNSRSELQNHQKKSNNGLNSESTMGWERGNLLHCFIYKYPPVFLPHSLFHQL